LLAVSCRRSQRVSCQDLARRVTILLRGQHLSEHPVRFAERWATRRNAARI
jgi:hypothetical protein